MRTFDLCRFLKSTTADASGNVSVWFVCLLLIFFNENGSPLRLIVHRHIIIVKVPLRLCVSQHKHAVSTSIHIRVHTYKYLILIQLLKRV